MACPFGYLAVCNKHGQMGYHYKPKNFITQQTVLVQGASLSKSWHKSRPPLTFTDTQCVIQTDHHQRHHHIHHQWQHLHNNCQQF